MIKSSMTFEEWALKTLGPEVVGVTDWSLYRECWNEAQLAVKRNAEDGYEEYWQREYAEHNIEGADRGFGENVWRDSRLAQSKPF